MRYSKFSGHETPRGVLGKWYDLSEFLDLKDLYEAEQPPPRDPADPLAASTAWVPQSHLEEREAEEQEAEEQEAEEQESEERF